MSDVRGKFSLTKSPQALPGHCGGCGRATDNLGFIDTGLQFEFYGALIFCSECTLDMASKFGYINMETADQLRNRVLLLEEETTRQRAALLGMEEAIDALQTVRINLDPSNYASNTSPTVIPETPEIPTQEEEGDGGTVSSSDSEKAEAGNSEIDGLTGEQEPVGVSSNSGYVDLDEL